MGSSTRGFPLHIGQAKRLTELAPMGVTGAQTKDSISSREEQLRAGFFQSLPCVVYECHSSMALSFVSDNVLELIGFEPRELVGNRSLWEERIFTDDSKLVRQKLDELKKRESVSMIHRLVDRSGLPVWVSHGLRKVSSEKGEFVRGCLLGIGDDMRAQRLRHGVVDRFVHKMGNHFQLLNLVISSLRKTLPKSRETDVLHETVEKVIELTRSFSAYYQAPGCWLAAVDLLEVFQAAVRCQKPLFLMKGITLSERIDPSIEQVSVSGDPVLLESALGHILQNALEATEKGGKVILDARAELEARVVKISVIDSGSGIEKKDLEQISSPFFSTKEGRDGLGLSVASRVVEMHSGLLQVRSVGGEGTEVEISLPSVAAERPPRK